MEFGHSNKKLIFKNFVMILTEYIIFGPDFLTFKKYNLQSEPTERSTY